MKHYLVFVSIFLFALNLTVMGQENPGRVGEMSSEQTGKTTDNVDSISIIGEVDYPGTYIMSSPLTLKEAILFVGGLKYSSARYGYLLRHVTEEEVAQDSSLVERKNVLENQNLRISDSLSGTEVIQIDLGPMKSGGALDPNILMEAGDTLIFPRRAIQPFYVIGDVTKPGLYEFPSGHTLLVSHAIAYSGGPSKTAKVSKAILLRSDEKGERQQIKFDLGAILRGESEDFEIFPNDIVFIPGSGAKTLGFGLLTKWDNPVIRRMDSHKYYYVIGEVVSPDAYEIESGQTILATQAIAKAGGPLKTAKMSEGRLVRQDKDGKRIEKPVDFKAILGGKEKDFEMFPGDFLFIPGSSEKGLFLDPPTNLPDFLKPSPIG